MLFSYWKRNVTDKSNNYEDLGSILEVILNSPSFSLGACILSR